MTEEQIQPQSAVDSQPKFQKTRKQKVRKDPNAPFIREKLALPEGHNKLLLHSCCAPCSGEVMEAILGTDKPVKNIDLSGVPHDVALPIIGVISRLIFDIQREQDMDNVRPVTIICDEAHVYIPDNFQLTASQRRMVEVFEDIAKEGRKFGITLFPATQRPSELNKTIVAQCANLIVGKLNNENDKSLIKGMLPDGDSELIEAVTMFHPGEVLMIGDAVPIPLKIKVGLAKERPVSRTINFWDAWKQGTAFDVTEMVDRYL